MSHSEWRHAVQWLGELYRGRHIRQRAQDERSAFAAAKSALTN